MKEFDKWYKNNDNFSCYECNGYEIGCEKGWKAALEWALSKQTSVYEDDDCNPPTEIVYVDIILEELEE